MRSFTDMDNALQKHKAEGYPPVQPRHKVGMMSFLEPISEELVSAQVLTLRVRQAFMHLRLKRDLKTYDDDLEDMSKCVYIA